MPPNNAPTNSPDAVGTHAAYFVSDFTVDLSLSQTITISQTGVYQIGFSAYAPGNGYVNFFDASFSGMIASVMLAQYNVSAGPSQTWQTFSGATNLDIGSYQIEFVFNTSGAPAKDVVIDQVYMVAGNPAVPVPEPASLALLGTGLVGLSMMRRRRSA